MNCTGSCSWKVYVKDGIITWETGRPITRRWVRTARIRTAGLPARGGVLLVHLLTDPGAVPLRARPAGRDVPRGQGAAGRPVLAWADIQADPQRRWRYQQARGKGGLVRVTWAEACEMIAAAHVHTIKAYGPDRIAGFSRSPRCPWSATPRGHGSVELIGGAMTSFYDWYADLPVASPQVFGDQTDVPESGIGGTRPI